MKEKPILFNGEMVKAILDGRKTMTRRVMRGACPYGAVGDRLWVRETWCPLNQDYAPAARGVSLPSDGSNVIVSYRADHVDPRGDAMLLQWRPAIFMPRWASRITLRIVNVRLELATWDSNPWVWVVSFEVLHE